MSQTQFITKEKKMDSEKIFQNQKEILEYLGKNPNDRNLISRMIRKWEIERMEDWYRIVEKVNVEEVEELKKRIAGLELDLAMSEAEKEAMKNNGVTMEELKYATAQWHYYEEEYEKEKKDKQNRIRKCFQWIKAKNPKANWEEFREWVMSNDE